MAAISFMVKESALGAVQSLSLDSVVSWLGTGSRLYGLNVLCLPGDRLWCSGLNVLWPPGDRPWPF